MSNESEMNKPPRWMKARSTHHARRAIADFVNDNTDNLSDWLHRVAYGIPKVNEQGELLRDNQGSVVYVLKPDPAAAIKAVSELAEYVLPKLSRGEMQVVAQVESTGTLTEDQVRKMSLSDLKRRLLESGSDPAIFDVPIDDPLAEPVDVVARMVPTEAHPEATEASVVPTVPDWLKGD